LLIPRCSSVHTFFMSIPIDIVYLNEEFEVVKVVAALRPWRFSVGGRAATQTLELPEGEAERLSLTAGQRIDAASLPRPRRPESAWAAAAGGVLGAVVGAARGFSSSGVIVVALFLAVLAAISVVDLRERRVPNAYTYPGTIVALAAAATGGGESIVLSVLGMLIGGGVMGAGFIIGRGRLGLGDVKLAAFAGSVLGARATPAFLLAGTALGAAVALAMLAAGRDRRSTFAYGPYLAAAAAVVALTRGPLLS
jgi:Flp pilus assembly protein protease CpaA